MRTGTETKQATVAKQAESNIGFEELVAEAKEVRQRKDGCQWDIGDLTTMVPTSRGRPSKDDAGENLRTFADKIGEAHGTVGAYHVVAKKLEKIWEW